MARTFNQPWAARLAAASFPAEPRDPIRGALASLVPLYELMLEVLEIRALRHEPIQVVVTAHILGEYLQPTRLGEHARARRRSDADGALRRRQPLGDRRPGLPALVGAAQSAAKRSLNACSGDLAGYTVYLDRFHSRLGEALGVCAQNLATVDPGRTARRGGVLSQPVQLHDAAAAGASPRPRRPGPAGRGLCRFADRRVAAPRPGRAFLRRAVGAGDLRGLAGHLGRSSPSPWEDGAIRC